jgi:hypothetical protein
MQKKWLMECKQNNKPHRIKKFLKDVATSKFWDNSTTKITFLQQPKAH